MDNTLSFESFSSNSSSTDSTEIKIRIALIGNSNVGKSSLIYRFLYNNFSLQSEPTIEDRYTTKRVINTLSCKIEILDTGGQEERLITIDSWIHSSNAFLLVYSIDDKESFENIMEKHDYIKQTKQNDQYSMIIIGNKNDLNIEQSSVASMQAQAHCAAVSVPFLEVSAKDNYNVTEAFLFVAKDYIIKKTKRQANRECRKTCCSIF